MTSQLNIVHLGLTYVGIEIETQRKLIILTALLFLLEVGVLLIEPQTNRRYRYSVCLKWTKYHDT